MQYYYEIVYRIVKMNTTLGRHRTWLLNVTQPVTTTQQRKKTRMHKVNTTCECI